MAPREGSSAKSGFRSLLESFRRRRKVENYNLSKTQPSLRAADEDSSTTLRNQRPFQNTSSWSEHETEAQEKPKGEFWDRKTISETAEKDFSRNPEWLQEKKHLAARPHGYNVTERSEMYHRLSFIEILFYNGGNHKEIIFLHLKPEATYLDHEINFTNVEILEILKKASLNEGFSLSATYNLGEPARTGPSFFYHLPKQITKVSYADKLDIFTREEHKKIAPVKLLLNAIMDHGTRIRSRYDIPDNLTEEEFEEQEKAALKGIIELTLQNYEKSLKREHEANQGNSFDPAIESSDYFKKLVVKKLYKELENCKRSIPKHANKLMGPLAFAKSLGLDEIAKYLEDFGFGGKDMSIKNRKERKSKYEIDILLGGVTNENNDGVYWNRGNLKKRVEYLKENWKKMDPDQRRNALNHRKEIPKDFPSETFKRHIKLDLKQVNDEEAIKEEEDNLNQLLPRIFGFNKNRVSCDLGRAHDNGLHYDKFSTSFIDALFIINDPQVTTKERLEVIELMHEDVELGVFCETKRLYALQAGMGNRYVNIDYDKETSLIEAALDNYINETNEGKKSEDITKLVGLMVGNYCKQYEEQNSVANPDSKEQNAVFSPLYNQQLIEKAQKAGLEEIAAMLKELGSLNTTPIASKKSIISTPKRESAAKDIVNVETAVPTKKVIEPVKVIQDATRRGVAENKIEFDIILPEQVTEPTRAEAASVKDARMRGGKEAEVNEVDFLLPGQAMDPETATVLSTKNAEEKITFKTFQR